jgi:hypothetical protein
METLITDPVLRMRYGAAGAERVRQAFSQDAVIGDLAQLFGLDMPTEAGSPRETRKRLCASHSTHP